MRVEGEDKRRRRIGREKSEKERQGKKKRKKGSVEESGRKCLS